MAAAFDEEDLSLTISTSNTRRGSNNARVPEVSEPQPSATHPQANPTQIAKRLGQYEIIKTLGEGSFGKVKLAIHRVSGQKVALKIIGRRKLVNRDMAGRIEREIQYLQLLRHPHIIKLYTVVTTPTEIIMVLEYAGGELFDYIVQHGRMPEDKARKFFQQIICAVEYCHRHKIVHRDLKPENLLLDENLNVKIADFGLSNIMTDGNFLKTSCGSPNYAAPEVISGKLYAGPEVDVWSCGVILYVLLVGRLPFDDEYIPALFKKIAQGNYMVPNYLSSGAVRLIRRMLQVNPVNRITIQEIRQDPWFIKNLAEYLQPPVEEFIDTGVDPNKAINPRRLAPSKPAAVQEKLHESIVGKLGKQMGYARGDVEEALAKDEAGAIKDAYLIVRENQLMKTNPVLSSEPALQPFLAQSPPAFNPTMPLSPPLTTPSRPSPSPLSPASDRPRHGSTSGGTTDVRGPVSTVAILPSSLPDYHRAYMKGHPKPNSPTLDDQSEGTPREQSSEQQAVTARRLKPHSRSRENIERANATPEGMTPLPPSHKKPRPTRWQFGIRSRNSPAEAMLAIYKALRAMGSDWEVPTPRKAGGDSSRGGSPDSDRNSSNDSDSDERRRRNRSSDSSDDDEHRLRREKRHRASESSLNERGRGRERNGAWNDWGYVIPEDPWVIHARFRKDGMFPPGVAHPSSTHSSRVDLHETSRRRSSTVGSTGSENNKGSHTGSTSAAHSIASVYPDADDSMYVYMTIQLYGIETDQYMVDFKCAGYERLIRKVAKEIGKDRKFEEMQFENKSGRNSRTSEHTESDGDSDDEKEEWMGAGRSTGEKDISSPFPFLDVASKLIIQLAAAD
ncbi:hypothetical protein LTR04_001943 [Oleoguttula sp. CCFEE 6159]|nr:hypothetical protein LTR04_001943 [Oleoguttula sp. CCFEE 6159]